MGPLPPLRLRVQARLAVTLVWLGLVAAVRPLSAQDPYVKITEPSEWRDGKALVIPAGRTVRIVGVAYHPAGIKEVQINGVKVTTEDDPPITRFEYVLTADARATTVRILIVPESSQPFERRYAMTPPADVSTDNASKDSTHAAVVLTGTTGSQPAVHAGSGFRTRVWFYGAGVVAGGVMSVLTSSSTSEVCTTTNGLQDCFNRTTTQASYRAAGIGLAAVSIVAGIIDYAVGSSKGTSVASGSPSGDIHGLSLGIAPVIRTGSGTSITLQIHHHLTF